VPADYNLDSMIQYLYLGRVGYEDGLRLQAEIAVLVAEGRLNNVLLLLEHPPVLTLGRNANRANVLASDALLSARGVTLHEINRGGDVTYHGPGQLVGYPIFDLRTLKNPNGGRMGPVDFVRGMEEALIGVCGVYGVIAGRVPGLTGVWVSQDLGTKGLGTKGLGTKGLGTKGLGTKGLGTEGLGTEGLETSSVARGAERKIGAIGIHVAKGITSHGFALNVTTDLRDFELIIPCGIPDHAVTSMRVEIDNPEAVPSLETVAHRVACQFGMVFEEHVLAVDSLEALRANALPAREFPAEDTPLSVTPEVERLLGVGERPVRA
jgi:lipoyl(octanoyl) transferase